MIEQVTVMVKIYRSNGWCCDTYGPQLGDVFELTLPRMPHKGDYVRWKVDGQAYRGLVHAVVHAAGAELSLLEVDAAEDWP